MSLRWLLLGRRLANREQSERKIGALEGIPAMGLDGLGSAAYGPEAALTILLPLGAAGLTVFGPIIGAIVALLAILFASYWQTIRAYPNNGGAYIVSKENLGTSASLLAAAALMVDYVLNVAVGISAGVGALVSAVPSLHPYTLTLCLAILAVVALANLRGTLDAVVQARNSAVGAAPAACSRCRPTCSSRASCWSWRSARTRRSRPAAHRTRWCRPLPCPAPRSRSRSGWSCARSRAGARR